MLQPLTYEETCIFTAQTNSFVLWVRNNQIKVLIRFIKNQKFSDITFLMPGCRYPIFGQVQTKASLNTDFLFVLLSHSKKVPGSVAVGYIFFHASLL